jgi:predicted kinase
MIVRIMQGIPGSGKSNYIRTHKRRVGEDPESSYWSDTIRSVSADHYHIIDGEYKYNPANASKAHSECLKAFIYYITETSSKRNETTEFLYVDNTNCTPEEIAPYYAIARAYGFPVEIVRFMTPVRECLRRQTHAVPEKMVINMYTNLTTRLLPPYWQYEMEVVYA